MHDISYAHRHELEEQNFAGCCRDCRRSLAIIKPPLMAFADRIRRASLDAFLALPLSELYRHYQLLDDLAHLDVGDHLAELILDEKEIRTRLPLIRSYYTAFFDIHEAHLARELLAADKPWDVLRRFPLYERYEVLVHSMLRAMPSPPCGRLAFIGCGPVPVTLVVLAARFDICSVGLDRDRRTVRLARRVIDCLGLEKQIEIVAGDEWALDRLDWRMVLTAALAEPKARIFGNLRKILQDRGPAPVIYRTYSGMRAVLHEPVRPEDIAGFHVIDTVQPSGRVNNTTVFLGLGESPGPDSEV